MARVCSMDGCERKEWSRGWCTTHYQRWRRHGDPNTVIKQERKNSVLCEFPSCERNAVAHGLCKGHYNRAHRANIEHSADALRQHDIETANAILAPYGLSVANG